MWYPVKKPFWASILFPNLLWKMPAQDPPCIYLSFDDGPYPEITAWVLQQLANYQAEASFFCIGKHVEEQPEIYQQILAAGHRVGNHSYSHLNGWKLDTKTYMEDVAACAKLVDSKLFRPPYGRLSLAQKRALQAAGYQIVLWDIMPGDFDPSCSGEKCLQRILHYIQNGSILVLHDSPKAFPRLQYLLPRLLEQLSQKGYLFKKI